MSFDLAMTDKLLSTTRAVRKRLDFSRPVEPEIIDECIELALQAPTGSNRQGWRWLVITDADKRKALADIYRRGTGSYLDDAAKAAEASGEKQNLRIFDSAKYLVDHFHEAPVHVLPCIESHIPTDAAVAQWAGLMGSIYPAVWSFQLALRPRGLGTVLTTLHLKYADEAAELLGIPDGIVQAGLLPVAYTIGTEFKPAKRVPLDTVRFVNGWG